VESSFVAGELAAMNASMGAEKRPTAGLRGASWDPAKLPSDMRTSVYPLATLDGAQAIGYLHARGGERTAVMIMHPRELLVSHYMVPYLVGAGSACWVQGPRTIGNDLRLEHEIALLDVAAGVGHLKKLGFERIVLLGNSGGAGLFAFYNQQSQTAAPQRLAKTPGGRPTKLGDAVMPSVDGFIFIAPHPGQGCLLQNCIDPSVIDESDPFSVDAALHAFGENNGYRAYPEQSRYTAEFIERYRAAQRARVERIDGMAKALIAERMEARGRSKAGGGLQDALQGAFNAIFRVWRTDADLRCFDLSLDASDRRWGTVWGADPIASNLGAVGFGRVCTAESWLSTWSGISSNASFERCGSSIEQPVLMLYYTGDNTVFPDDARSIFAFIASRDKIRIDIRGNHHGHSLRAGEPIGQEIAGAHAIEWLREKFG
jgi:pimeloyl-ACP methyl ester carboxylesterase